MILLSSATAALNIESLIGDLAFILILGAAVTIVFKWIKQPVVLGYIVAGFLASPNFTPIPSVANIDNIEFWAQLGIVVLLFSLGLEFSFKKLMGVGGSAIVTALVIVTGMMCTGIVVGHVLGFSMINCIFLGGMLSMSSTTIIIKAFNDMGLQRRKFASLVFAVLVIEDLFAVLMMVILSSVAINRSVEGTELLMSVAKLVFFLVIWSLTGIYLIPTLLNRVRSYLNEESLLIVSMGLCLGMAVFSVMCGFSLALGAFVMGSILAGTSYAERIEAVTAPVKDLFGSVFFISVGMMVQPDVIVNYWQPILILSASVIVGMILFGTVGMLVTGQPLKIAIEAGFSLTQIGEFAFIIATLGMSLGVLDSTIYPIVVAVSVITTFTTPYFIRMAPGAYRLIEKALPEQVKRNLDKYCEECASPTANRKSERRVWMPILRRSLMSVLLYSIILIAITLLATGYLEPLLNKWVPEWAQLLTAIAGLAAMSPFLIALTRQSSSREERREMRRQGVKYRVPLVAMSIVKMLIVLGFLINFLMMIYNVMVALVGGVIAFVLILFVFSRRIGDRMSRIETRFIDNLNERDLRRSGRNNNIAADLNLAYMRVGYGCPFVGMKLVETPLRSEYDVSVVNIRRGDRSIPVPSGDTRLYPGDTIGVIGHESSLEALVPLIERPDQAQDGQPADDYRLREVELTASSPIVGKTIMEADVRRNYHAHIVTMKREDQFADNLLETPLKAGDIVWVVGSKKAVREIEGNQH